MATHSSILAWEAPWTEEPGWLQSTGLWRVTREHTHAHTQSLYNVHCASFCCPMKWISSIYTHVLSLLDLHPILAPIPPGHQGHHETPSWASCTLQQVPASSVTYGRKSSFTLGFPSLVIPSTIQTSQVYPTGCCKTSHTPPNPAWYLWNFWIWGFAVLSCFEQFRLLFHQLFILPAFPSGTPNYV